MSDESDTGPEGLDPRGQGRSGPAVAGLVLYEKPWCPFCMRVEATLRSLGIELERRDVEQDAAAARELVEQGGSRMVPCLYIPDGGAGQWLYESSDITAYLRSLVEGDGGGASEA